MSDAMPRRRQLDFRAWPEVLADVDQLHTTGYVRAGNWELSQILDHLAVGLRTAMEGTENRGPWILRKLIGPILLRGMLRKRRMQAGIKVPDWWLPGPSHDESVAVEEFSAVVASFARYAGPTHPHPLLGALDKEQWNELALIHSSHHLSFLSPKAS